MNDQNYIDGIEDGILMVKNIFSLSREERVRLFGDANVATILDTYEFPRLREIMNRIEICNKYYVIRGVKETGVKKTVVAESMLQDTYPTMDEIHLFMRMHREVDFASVEIVYKRG